MLNIGGKARGSQLLRDLANVNVLKNYSLFLLIHFIHELMKYSSKFEINRSANVKCIHGTSVFSVKYVHP